MDIPASLKSIIEAVLGPRLDLLALYPAKVVGQSGDTVEVVPDDSRIPGTTGVPIYSGTPGVKCEIPPGTRVLLGFRGGDRRSPYVALWEAVSPMPKKTTVEAQETVEVKGPDGVTVDSSAVKLGKTALLGVARMGDAVQAGPWAGVITAGSTKVKAE